MSFEATAPDDVLLAAPALQVRVEAIFAALGCAPREATAIAEHLVLANLMGHDSHGVSLIPLYVRMVREGRVAPNRRVSTVLDAGPLVTLEAHRGFGQATALEAMELAVARARRDGAAVVGLRNSHHVGRVGHWAERCAAAGLVSLHFVNVVGSAAVVAPFAGADARIHTNPVAIGMPRPGDEPLILDFATSRVAQGKLRVAMNRGLQVPEGHLIDAEGRPSTEPRVTYEPPFGALLPFGEHKGSGLGLFCDLLAGALTGGGTAHAGTLEEGVYLNNMLSIVLDPQRLGGQASWQRDLLDGIAWFAASPPRDPERPVLLPGEPERLTRRRRLAEGIPIDRETWRQIEEAARSVGL
ncbi:uncharacterized oxidoreductase [Tistlia consotensis]|uniref:Uncharacterized oxidoreductase n=1 Tax=Tistlia consotensis USBA 355 TaxID=560819 RepID=A0A1Y6BCV0_9PROT|nr:malate/lactate/ureidoglycolate dehydrogenase [Tistlia consotensis]SME97464.1 uncharacterized oxidoreductase [Tistlia consotensis USBA 355]SNR56822.1 uncharacterized oxidoreductase [Tistlia consotensis]